MPKLAVLVVTERVDVAVCKKDQGVMAPRSHSHRTTGKPFDACRDETVYLIPMSKLAIPVVTERVDVAVRKQDQGVGVPRGHGHRRGGEPFNACRDETVYLIPMSKLAGPVPTERVDVAVCKKDQGGIVPPLSHSDRRTGEPSNARRNETVYLIPMPELAVVVPAERVDVAVRKQDQGATAPRGHGQGRTGEPSNARRNETDDLIAMPKLAIPVATTRVDVAVREYDQRVGLPPIHSHRRTGEHLNSRRDRTVVEIPMPKRANPVPTERVHITITTGR
ncbi:MAG: hypothetical protein N2320_05995 [Candidatus Bipolaricaulota bacterium]|nr:hypothetical protein [Candidatus Bipolaricaulota bacterium]